MKSISFFFFLAAQLLILVLANVFASDDVHLRKVDLSNCGLGDIDLNKLWSGLAGQAETIEYIDTSNNNGTVGFDTLTYTLRQLRNIKKLNISGNTRLVSEEPLFAEGALQSWALQELDLSGIVVSGLESTCFPFS